MLWLALNYGLHAIWLAYHVFDVMLVSTPCVVLVYTSLPIYGKVSSKQARRQISPLTLRTWWGSLRLTAIKMFCDMVS